MLLMAGVHGCRDIKNLGSKHIKVVELTARFPQNTRELSDLRLTVPAIVFVRLSD